MGDDIYIYIFNKFNPKNNLKESTKNDHKISSTKERNCDRDVGHEINGGDDDGNPTQVDASWGDPASLERVRVRTHDEIDLTAAGNTVTVQVVHVKNILLEAACGLLIGPRKQGIRYSGRENITKWVTHHNGRC